MQAFESDPRSLRRPYKNTLQAEDLQRIAGTASKYTQKVYFAERTIHYLYDATGRKVMKHITDDVLVSEDEVDYLGGFQYKNGILQFFPHAEGYVNIFYCEECESEYQYMANYVYNYLDHLGNIRMSYAIDPESEELEILEENHYYPFGLKHTNYNSDLKVFRMEEEQLMLAPPVIPSFTTEYKYKYNGKELQDELGLNFYDYGARNYDPAIGRWMNIDPLSEAYRRWTPYNYCMNNPIYFIDPDGMEVREHEFGITYTGSDATRQ